MKLTDQQISETVPIVRSVLEQIAHKWTILILTVLCEEPQRFNALKRHVHGITQKALTETLRKLERNGLIQRAVTTTPITVVYSITPLGRTLQEPFRLLCEWGLRHQSELLEAQGRFDQVPSPS